MITCIPMMALFHSIPCNVRTCLIDSLPYFGISEGNTDTDTDTEWTLCHGKCFYL